LDGLDVAQSLLPPDAAVPDAPRVDISESDTARIANGQPVPAHGLHAEVVRVYDPSDRLVCLARADGDQLQPRLML
jgi:hypothetical protein